MTGLLVAGVVAVLTGLVVAAMVVDHRNRKRVARRPDYQKIKRLQRGFPR